MVLEQQQRLLDIGAWLKINGEAIYGTTYWHHAEEPTGDDKIRYTVKDGTLYATALEWPGAELTLGADTPVAPSFGVSTITRPAESLCQGSALPSEPSRVMRESAALDDARTAPGVTGVHVTGRAGRPSTVQLPAGTSGRYVRVQLTSGTNPLSLAEVEVRGH